MNFSDALKLIKEGERVARECWDGKDMFLFFVPGSRFRVNRPPLLGIYPEGTRIEYHAHIDIKTEQGYVMPWTAPQSDILAEDWEIYRSKEENGFALQTIADIIKQTTENSK
jgi:hypothetical protein